MLAVEVKKLTKFFARRAKRRWGIFPGSHLKSLLALDNVDLAIQPGEFVGLLGPNGAGKTTLVKCLATLLISDSGEAKINGYDVVKESKKVQAMVGLMTGGERGLYWKLSFVDNLNYFAALYGLSRRTAEKRIAELASIMILSERKDERLEKLSSGMRQKAALARTILHDPQVLFLDEPTLGLDPVFSRFIRGFMKDELNRKQKKTILLTTHNMEEAEILCDRVVLIDKGKIVASGTPEELKNSLGIRHTCKVVFTGKLDGLDLKAVFGDTLIYVHNGDNRNEMKLNEIPTNDLINKITGVLGGPRRIVSIAENSVSLEDVFIKFTGQKLE